MKSSPGLRVRYYLSSVIPARRPRRNTEEPKVHRARPGKRTEFSLDDIATRGALNIYLMLFEIHRVLRLSYLL